MTVFLITVYTDNTHSCNAVFLLLFCYMCILSLLVFHVQFCQFFHGVVQVYRVI